MAGRYDVLSDAGNVRTRNDGTHEIITLPGLTQNEEKLARLAIEHDNAYITKAQKAQISIEKMRDNLQENRKDFETIAYGGPEQILEKAKAPEQAYRRTLDEIIESYTSSNEERDDQVLREITPGTSRETKEIEPAAMLDRPPKESAKAQLVELARKSRDSSHRSVSSEMEMGD
ncbi:hypothetical protein VSQ99_03485 [Nocardiopsis alba]